MSRLANKPIVLPQGIDIVINGNKIIVKGKRGELSYEFQKDIKIVNDNGSLWVKAPDIESKDEKVLKSHKKAYSPVLGLTWTLIKNMIIGVNDGYKKVLLLEGTGYRANIQGDILTLQLGFSSDVKMKVPNGISVKIEKDVKITIEGNDKEAVGELAMVIKKKRPVEPYKGKGVRFEGEQVKRKESKKASK